MAKGGKVGSVEVTPPAGSEHSGAGKPRRWHKNPEKLIEGADADIRTVYEIIQRSARLFPSQNGFGHRTLVKMHNEEKEVTKTVKGKEVKETKKWQYFEMSDYKYMSYKQIADDSHVIGSGLRAVGLEKGKIFNIYAATAPSWQLVAQGCVSQSVTFATAYDSLGPEGLQHSINEPEVSGIFTNDNLLPTLAKVVGKCPTLKVVIYDGDKPDSKALETIKNANEGIRIITLKELMELGRKEHHDPVPPVEEDTCCIMYTSGSTGAPKGVILSHRNICASTAAVHFLLVHILQPTDSYIAFLPLAHIFEFVVELIMLYHAIPVGYANIKTLSDASMRNCKGDMVTLKPTIMVGVPAVWEQIRKGIVGKVKEGGKERIFNAAMSLKRNSTILGHVADTVVFNKVKQATGGRLRYALSGGASISKETQEFLQTAVVTMLQGYGMTETSAMCAILPPEFLRTESVGVPVPCAEIKLVDVEDMKYSATGNPPRGEIWLRGPSITKGYYKREDLTKEAITEDGWFITGDIGQWNPDGTLSIIDRKKNLVKLSGGEYIALEQLETAYGSCNLVTKICMHADSAHKQPMAVIFPNEKNLRAACASHGHAENEDLRTLCEDDKVRDVVVAELNAVGKKAGFKNMQLCQAVVIDPEEWTPHNGMLTAAQKLQRKAIVEKHQKEIDEVYKAD